MEGQSVPRAEPAAADWLSGLRREARSLWMSTNLRCAIWHSSTKLLPNYALCSTRAQMYRLAGCDLAPGVAVQGPMVLLGSGPRTARLHMGAGCIVAPLVTFALDADIDIGRNVSIGPATAFHTATHAVGFGSRRMQLATQAYPIVVEDGVWIGAQSLILPGVTIGRGSIIAAGSVIAANVQPSSFMSGNPAELRETLPFADR